MMGSALSNQKILGGKLTQTVGNRESWRGLARSSKWGVRGSEQHRGELSNGRG